MAAGKREGMCQLQAKPCCAGWGRGGEGLERRSRVDSDAVRRASTLPCIAKPRPLVTKVRSSTQHRIQLNQIQGKKQCEVDGTANKGSSLTRGRAGAPPMR
jgi:hypothetical protein